MNQNRVLLFLLAFIVLNLSFTMILQGQTTSNEQNRSSFSSPFLDGNSLFFIDQVGIQFLSDVVPDGSFFDDETYVIGPQDVITIDVKGPVAFNARAVVVNSNGYVFLPYTGNILIGGLTINDARNKIISALQEELSDFTLAMTIQKPRPVQVDIVGDIPFPGKYTLRAGSRLDLALSFALFEEIAPDSTQRSARYSQQFFEENNFSLRNIRINRNNLNQRESGDIIRYFKTGDKSANPFIYDGDIITVRSLNENSPRVSVSGAVISPAEMEFNRSESVESLLELSGGYLDGADTTRAILHRDDNGRSSVIEIDLTDDDLSQYSIQPNDRLIIPYQNNNRRSASAWVYGEALTPGNFPITHNETTLGELIRLAGGVTADALENGAYIIRSQIEDRNVPSATRLNTQELKRTSDQLLQGFEYLDMERELYGNEQRMFIDLSSETDLNQVRITDGDELYIPLNYHNVILYGQVNNPGNYPFNSESSIRDYLQKAGGLSIAANPDRIFVIKAGSRAWKAPSDTNLESGDMIFVDRMPFDELEARRNYEFQQQNLRMSNLQIILSAVSTLTAVVTTYVVVTR